MQIGETLLWNYLLVLLFPWCIMLPDEFTLFIAFGLLSDIFLGDNWDDEDDVIILSLDESELDIWAIWPESFFVSDAPDGVGIPTMKEELKKLYIFQRSSWALCKANLLS